MLERKPLELSGGQQQRTALARALVKDAGPGAARRAARQPRLQAPRGAARRAAAHLRGDRRDLRLRHHRARRGAAARREYGDALARAGSPQFGPTARSIASPATARRASLLQPADELPSAIAKKGDRSLWRAAACRAGRRSPALPTAATRSVFRPHHLGLSRAPRRASCAARWRSPSHRLGKLRPPAARRRRSPRRAHGVRDFAAGRRRGYLDPATSIVFDADGRLVAPARPAGRLRTAPWPGSPRDSRTATAAAAAPAGLRAEARSITSGGTAAPMRCSARRAAARPRCSTSSPACCARPRAGCSSATAT